MAQMAVKQLYLELAEGGALVNLYDIFPELPQGTVDYFGLRLGDTPFYHLDGFSALPEDTIFCLKYSSVLTPSSPDERLDIDLENMIVRKGAISAQAGEKLLIPINMRDGSLICIGKGNPDWNYSAPHGAGRIMSRKQAFTNLSLDEYKKSMANIFSNGEIPELEIIAYEREDIDKLINFMMSGQ